MKNAVLKKENALLYEKLDALKQQSKVIDFYCKVEQNGILIKEISDKYDDLKAEHKELKQRYKEETTQLQESVTSYKEQL